MAPTSSLTSSCRDAIAAYRVAVSEGTVTTAVASRARRALLYLGGDPECAASPLHQYDHRRHGPFLGVSDEGSAAAAIRDAAMASPKVRALANRAMSPIVVGVAVDAERLGGIGEVAVGPEEYADVWLACVDRVLITTNVGTRVNLRVYRREPRIVLRGADPGSIERAQAAIADAFKPFVATPDRKPRPLTVLVEIPSNARLTTTQKRFALQQLSVYVASGKAAGKRRAPKDHALGLAVRVGWGPAGKAAAMVAIDLATSAGIGMVVIDGVKRKDADEAISYAGLLDYFRPGLIGPILRHAKKRGVRVRPANLPDADTIARGVWATLNTARGMGANLGKYGCFPLTLAETDRVVEEVQRWTDGWAAAPVFFVDQGLLSDERVDVGRDLVRGIVRWLETVRARGARVVLIDTIDKATGRRLLRTEGKDPNGYLGPQQIVRIEARAAELGVKVLWAGGLGLRDAYEMGELGVFGIYVTSAAAITIPVSGVYVRDPGLAGVKEPQKEAVLRTKVLLEAGFLAANVIGPARDRIAGAAARLLAALDAGDGAGIASHTRALAKHCVTGWGAHWKAMERTGATE